ncbi:MAG: hypothetical protein AB1634_15755 [Thermodesulfobacteriota bacterium]
MGKRQMTRVPEGCREAAVGLLVAAAQVRPPAVFLITSPGAREGRTFMAGQLARILAAEGQRTALVSHHPAGDDGPSLAAVCQGQQTVAWLPGVPTLLALPDPHAGFLYQPPGPKAWLPEAQILIIDGLPVRHVFCRTLAPLVDGVVLVTDTRHARLTAVRQAAAAIGQQGGKLLGVVLNRHRSPLPSFLRFLHDV